MWQKRKKVWIDRFQTVLVLRILVHLVIYQAAVCCLLAVERGLSGALGIMSGEAATGYFLLLMLITVVSFGFLFACDALRASHRLVGPLRRFRHVIRAVTAGEEVDLVRLRKGDWLGDMQDEFNAMLQALEQRGAITLKPAPAAEPNHSVPV